MFERTLTLTLTEGIIKMIYELLFKNFKQTKSKADSSVLENRPIKVVETIATTLGKQFFDGLTWLVEQID